MKSLNRHRLLRFLLASRQEQKWPYLWRAWAEATILAYLVANLVQLVAPFDNRRELNLSFVISAVLIGPWLETMAFQFLPLEVGASLKVRRWLRLAFSIVPFAFMHGLAGLPTVLGAGLIGGYYFAFTYERWRTESLLVAVAMTFLLHASFNLVGVVGMILLSH